MLIPASYGPLGGPLDPGSFSSPESSGAVGDLLASQEKLCRAVDVLVGIAGQSAREERCSSSRTFSALPLEVFADRVHRAPSGTTKAHNRAVSECRLDGCDLVGATRTVRENTLEHGVKVIRRDGDRAELLRHPGVDLGVF